MFFRLLSLCIWRTCPEHAFAFRQPFTGPRQWLVWIPQQFYRQVTCARTDFQHQIHRSQLGLQRDDENVRYHRKEGCQTSWTIPVTTDIKCISSKQTQISFCFPGALDLLFRPVRDGAQIGQQPKEWRVTRRKVRFLPPLPPLHVLAGRDI